MKMKMLTMMLLAVLLLSGFCGCSHSRVDKQPDAAGNRIAMAANTPEDSVRTGSLQAPSQTVPQTAITREEATAIALEHAGFTADQVTYLRTEYDWDDRVPHYEVEFRQGRWEYDYEINADTGAIMSFDIDD